MHVLTSEIVSMQDKYVNKLQSKDEKISALQTEISKYNVGLTNMQEEMDSLVNNKNVCTSDYCVPIEL